MLEVKEMGLNSIGVVGAGAMGTGIAHVAAMSGYQIILRDIDQKYLDKSINRMSSLMDRSISKGKITGEDKANTLGRVKTTTELGDFKDCDLIVEAVIENMDLKQQVFAELNTICKEETIFATNTSSMSVTAIGAASGREDRFCGIHFFNPVQVMKLVEIISGLNTSEATIKAAYDLAQGMGKTPVHVKKDIPGFIVNRLLVPYLNEAAQMYAEGIASIEDIDTAVKLGLNYPMGPFQMLDMGGVDLTVTIMDYFKEEFGNNKYAPELLLRQMVRANKLGQKTGEGFYKYDA